MGSAQGVLLLLVLALLHASSAVGSRSKVLGLPLDFSQLQSKVCEGSELVWQVPSSPKAVLFIVQGCSGGGGATATAFWDEHPNCPACIGLPEERALAIQALAHDYLVIAVSGNSGDSTSCSDDHLRTAVSRGFQILDAMDLRQHLPVVGLGGEFISKMASHFDAVVLMVSAGDQYSIKGSNTYPPTLFLHMPRDSARAESVQQAMQLLKAKGTTVTEVLVHPIPITPHLFSQKITGLDEKTSERMHSVLKESGVLDGDGFLRKDPRFVNWQMLFRKRQVLPVGSPGKLNWEDHIQELLNAAYGYHEFTSQQSDAVFQWLDGLSLSLWKGLRPN